MQYKLYIINNQARIHYIIMTKEVFKKVADGYKGMPTSLKVAYYLIVLSLALNIYSVVRFCGAKKTGGKVANLGFGWTKIQRQYWNPSINML